MTGRINISSKTSKEKLSAQTFSASTVSDEAGAALPSEEQAPEQDVVTLCRSCKVKKSLLWSALVTMVVAVGVTVIAMLVIRKSSANDDDTMENGMPKQSNEYYQERYATFQPLVQQYSNPALLLQSSSPQTKALEWLVYRDNLLSHQQIPDPIELAQRYAVLVLYYACDGERWLNGFDLDEFTSIPTCEWENGETFLCQNNAITDVILEARGLVGQLPDELALLSNLKTLELASNSLKGTIPDSFIEKASVLGMYHTTHVFHLHIVARMCLLIDILFCCWNNHHF
jgi:hypothetical protein